MDQVNVQAIVLAVIGVLGGAFGRELLNRWFDRDKALTEAKGKKEERAFADNEQAREWLSEQLDERDEDLKSVRASERELLKQVADLAATVARLEERSNAQATQIEELKAAVTRWNTDYLKMEQERDTYRQQKHDAENKLTPLTVRAQLAERDLKTREQEIEQLRGQIAVLAERREGA